MPARKIIHLDMDAFFCAVEELNTPELKGKAFAVGGRPDQRGVVASCSYAARQKGVRSAMPMGKALKLCPGMLIVSSGYGQYSAYSGKVMAILRQVSEKIEPLSIDEAFLDVSALPGDLESICKCLQKRIMTETGLPCSIGAAGNKLVAKIATDVGKGRHKKPTPPCSILIVPAGEERQFLAPLPVGAMWGVGPKTAERLQLLGFTTIGDLADAGEVKLIQLLGNWGLSLARHAAGMDDRDVVTEYDIKSQSQEMTFNRDVSDEAILKARLAEMSKQVAESLVKHHVEAQVVRLKIRWSNFETHTRQIKLDRAFNDGETIRTTAEKLLAAVWTDGRPVRLIGVGASDLISGAKQLDIWHAPSEKALKLQTLLEDTEKKFGRGVLVKGLKSKSKDQ